MKIDKHGFGGTDRTGSQPMKRSYILEFKRVTDTGEKYVSETQKLVEIQHLVITQDLKRLFKDTQWTVEQLSFVTGHKSVSASAWRDLLSKFDISKDVEDRVKVIKNLGRTLLDELENLFRSYWAHRLGVEKVSRMVCSSYWGTTLEWKHRRSKVINSKTLNSV